MSELMTADELRQQGKEVKPCPFCGETQSIQFHDDDQRWPTMECTYCGCSMSGDEDYDALYYWNQRVSEGGWVRRL